MFAHVFGVDLGALLLAGRQVEPRNDFERNQTVFADPGQAADRAASRHDERIVDIVQQNRGQAGNGLVQRYRSELTARRQQQAVERSSEQFDHRRVAIIGGLLKPIEDWFARVAGLTNGIAAGFDELPECVAERRGQRLDVQDDVEVLGGAKCQPGLFHRQAGGGAPDQDVLVGVGRKPSLEDVQSSHHGNCSFSSSSASWTRSSALSCRLSVNDSGSTVVLSGTSPGR